MMTRSIVIFVQAVMSGLRRHVKIRIAPTASNDQTPHCQTIAKFFLFSCLTKNPRFVIVINNFIQK